MMTVTNVARTPETTMTLFCEAMNRGDLDSTTRA